MGLHDSEGFTELAMGKDGPQSNQEHGLYVEFYMHAVQDQAASLEANRPIFTEKEYVKIMTPGNKTAVIDRPVRIGFSAANDNNRFAQEYTMFKRATDGESPEFVGTPLAEWAQISKSQCLELQHFHVKSVEQLLCPTATRRTLRVFKFYVIKPEPI